MFDLKKIFLAVLIFLSLCFFKVGLDNDFKQISAEKKFLPPSKDLKYLSFGFNEILADSLWLRWIQNIDACGKALTDRGNVINSDALSDNKFAATITSVQKKKVCSQGWSFRMLDAVTDLSPKFRTPYGIGASNLSVIAEDHIGAKLIFEKGAKQFPKDWRLLYQGAYHFLYELNDLKSAGDWLKRAADNGAPDWLYSLSSRVYTEAGQIEFGIKRLEDYLKGQTDPKLIESIKNRIMNLKKSL